MRLNMGNWRVWLFCGLVAVAAGFMVASAIMPWWTCEVVLPAVAEEVGYESFVIEIYQYGLPPVPDIDPRTEWWIAGDITPFYQTVFAWIYITASVGLILYSTWLKGRKGQFLLGGIGLIYIAYAAIAVFVVIASRTGDLGISLEGASSIEREQQEVILFASLQFGYYLAYGAGLMCIVLALLRNMIIGKPKLGG